MRIEVKVPELSESVQGGTLLEWRYKPGDTVKRDDTLVDLETDKVILEVTAPGAGVLTAILVPAGSEVKSGQVLAEIDSEAAAVAPSAAPPMPAPVAVAAAVPAPVPAPVPVAAGHATPSQRRGGGDMAPAAPPAPVAAPAPAPASAPAPRPVLGGRGERREPMSRLRLRIAERLKEAQNTAAMLTTFNEINMQPTMDLRARYQERFQKRHGVKLGFMSIFVKASCKALRDFPMVNACIEGRDIVFHDYLDIGVAVSSERGLVVPVLRDADGLGYADIEKRIADFGRRANSLELKLEEMEGGTFTISNGGVFGSMLSTPILNPPQSAVLGLHKIQDRPVAENGQVVIRPMMYVALSYDHRLIDGREAVSFLKAIKEAMEDPAGLLLDM